MDGGDYDSSAIESSARLLGEPAASEPAVVGTTSNASLKRGLPNEDDGSNSLVSAAVTNDLRRRNIFSVSNRHGGNRQDPQPLGAQKFKDSDQRQPKRSTSRDLQTAAGGHSAYAATDTAIASRPGIDILGDTSMQSDAARETALDAFPQVILDGTKVILRVRHNQTFQVDHSLKIIFSSHKLRRLERFIAYSTFLSDADSLTTVVIDSGAWNLKFVPVFPSLHGGIIYTRDGSAHVVLSVAGEMRRSKVSAPSLPCKVCNKFVSSHSYSNAKIIQDRALERSSLSEKSSSAAAWSLYTSTVGMGGAGGGVIFVRVDDSIFRYRLGGGGCSIPPQAVLGEDAIEDDGEEYSPLGTGGGGGYYRDNYMGHQVTPAAPIRERRRGAAVVAAGGGPPLSAAAAAPNTPPVAGGNTVTPDSCRQPVDFTEGRPVMWTAGLDFEFKTVMFCCKKVTGACGDGVIWVDNPRQSQSSHSTSLAN